MPLTYESGLHKFCKQNFCKLFSYNPLKEIWILVIIYSGFLKLYKICTLLFKKKCYDNFWSFFCKYFKSFPMIPICLGIWEIPQKPGNPGNSQMQLGIWKSIERPKWIWGHLGNSSNIPSFAKFWEFPNAWESGKFLKYLVFWAIPQIPILLQSIIVVGSCNSGK